MPLRPYLSRVPYCGGTGICRFDDLPMTEDARRAASERCPNPRSVAVFLFPYLVRDETPRNLSLYACGPDYHTVIGVALEPLCAQLRQDFPDNTFVILSDASPLPEVQAAWISGAGILGSNGLIFDRTYGSFVFIGTILTDLECTPTPSAQERCPDCGLCRRSCPSGALDTDGRVACTRCLSDVTQSKQDLTAEQEEELSEHPLIWGCDTCSLVCPLNRGVPETPNPAFHEGRLTALAGDDVDGLTRKQFLARYPDRAFTWRGPKPLQRNLKLKQSDH